MSPNGIIPRARQVAAARHVLSYALALLIAVASACDRSDATRPVAYTSRIREITITTVPLLVKEEQGVLPFLKEDFARGGVLEAKEVYAFSPSTITAVEGDTIHFTFINPEDDAHSFVLPDLVVSLPGQKVTTATYVAHDPGIHSFVCAVQTHLPMMWGQLIVLPRQAMAGANGGR
jgi:plastocyanin